MIIVANNLLALNEPWRTGTAIITMIQAQHHPNSASLMNMVLQVPLSKQQSIALHVDLTWVLGVVYLISDLNRENKSKESSVRNQLDFVACSILNGPLKIHFYHTNSGLDIQQIQ